MHVTIGGMRLLIEVRDERVPTLRDLAVLNHRSVREQASFLLEQRLIDEQKQLEPSGEAA